MVNYVDGRYLILGIVSAIIFIIRNIIIAIRLTTSSSVLVNL